MSYLGQSELENKLGYRSPQHRKQLVITLSQNID
jgi:hypothetical protein